MIRHRLVGNEEEESKDNNNEDGFIFINDSDNNNRDDDNGINNENATIIYHYHNATINSTNNNNNINGFERRRRLRNKKTKVLSRRIRKQRRRRRDWRTPLGILGVTSLVLLSISLILLSQQQKEEVIGNHEEKLNIVDNNENGITENNDNKNREKMVNNNNENIQHVVITRFMQNQSNLLWLGRARLVLFEYICLPTMLGQTTTSSDNVIWIIVTDPDLPKELVHKLRQLIRSYSYILFIGSNESNEDGDLEKYYKELLKAPLYSGNIKLLRQLYSRIKEGTSIEKEGSSSSSSSPFVLLQTRLDADDGLRYNYLETIQKEAWKIFFSSSNNNNKMNRNWYYWCVKRHLEWYASTNDWNPVEHSKLCITPGLTIGIRISSSLDQKNNPSSLPPWSLGHDVLFKHITNFPNKYNCHNNYDDINNSDNDNNNNSSMSVVDSLSSCIKLLAFNNNYYDRGGGFGVIRSRTWTSAGMMNIFPPSNNNVNDKSSIMESLVKNYFAGISNISLKNVVQSYLQRHIADIAYDNLIGQCTYGHSCKLSSIETLQRLIELQYEGKDGIAIVE